METISAPSSFDELPRPPAYRLGEELPIFCERCGYSLHGLPQNRCGHCEILHFSCPECGHHQPINTLRPAVQAVLGRIRAWVLGIFVLLRIAYFLGLLCAWVGMGAAWSSQYYYTQGGNSIEWRPVPISREMLFAFGLFGLAFGAVSRMVLLRWRRGAIVGLWLAGVVVVAACFGAWMEYRTSYDDRPWPFTSNLLIGIGVGACAIVLAAAVAWPIWCGLVRVFLPRRASEALLRWQRSLSEKPSDRAVSALAREEVRTNAASK